MKLQYITGCTYNDLHIDYANADMLPTEKLQDICKTLEDGDDYDRELNSIEWWMPLPNYIE